MTEQANNILNFFIPSAFAAPVQAWFIAEGIDGGADNISVEVVDELTELVVGYIASGAFTQSNAEALKSRFDRLPSPVRRQGDIEWDEEKRMDDIIRERKVKRKRDDGIGLDKDKGGPRR